jgi:GNAT superfamily N-acetyltransferase
MSEVVIRPGVPGDLPQLDRIEGSGAETFARYGRPLADGSPPAPPDQWAEALTHGLLLVAEDAQDGLIGFLAGETNGDELYIEEVDVVMERQRQGVGRRLMAAAIDWARRAGLAAVTLTTFRAIPWNAPFYRSLGFVVLTADTISERLAAILADETARGFEDRGAMRLAL